MNPAQGITFGRAAAFSVLTIGMGALTAISSDGDFSERMQTRWAPTAVAAGIGALGLAISSTALANSRWGILGITTAGLGTAMIGGIAAGTVAGAALGSRLDI